MNARKTAFILLMLPLLTQATPTPPPADKGRSEMQEVNLAFLQVVAALAVVMIAVNALRYVTSDNPQERADIKKSLTYVIIGLIIVYLARALVKGIYCYALYKAWGIATTECEKYI
jgi:hypothetical protein